MSHRCARRATPFVAALLTLAGASLSATAQKPKVESQVLLTAEPGVQAQFWISHKGQHLAAIVLRGSRQVIVYDGTDGPRFDEIFFVPNLNNSKIVWSEDGSRYAYFGKVGQELVVIVDGKDALRTPWDAQMANMSASQIHDLGFTPRSKHWYVVLFNNQNSRSNYQVVVDGKPGPVSQERPMIAWSPDGEHHAYLQTINPPNAPQPSMALVVDGKAAPYLAGEPEFTSDGLHLFTKRPVPRATATDILADGQPFMRVEGAKLYMAPTGPGVLSAAWVTPPNGTRTAFVTVGNRKVPGSECSDNAGIDAVFISADAKHFAARCQRQWILVDGKKGMEYPGGFSDVAFTADGRGVYRATTNNKAFVIVGDQESDGYATIFPVEGRTRQEQASLLTPAVIQGNSFGYIARSGASGFEFVVVVNGKKYPAVAASNLTFSPDGSRFAFLAGHPTASAVVDGTAYSTLGVDATLGHTGFQGTFQWSADNKHVAWIVAAPQNGVAIDGKFFATNDRVRLLKFTGDGKHLVWLMRVQTGYVVFVDGVQVLELPLSLALENEADVRWSFPEDGSIVFIAQDGDAMKRFKITPGSGTSVETALAKAK